MISCPSLIMPFPVSFVSEDEYGILEVVAAPGNFIEGEMLKQKLQEHGIKATLTQTRQGPRILVFPNEAKAAAAVLRTK